MVDQRQGSKKTNREEGLFLKTWMDSYAEVSKMWEDSYLQLQKSWIGATGDLADKAAQLSKEGTPKQYEEFFDEWLKAARANYGRFFPIPTLEHNEETLAKLMVGAKESSKLYKSWVDELEENSKKTQQLLSDKGEPKPEEYKKAFDAWMKTYKKIFNELIEAPSVASTKEIFESYTGMPDVYFGSFVQISKLWRESYAKLYGPWTDAVLDLAAKTAELSKGNADPKAFEDFYKQWMDTYGETYGKSVESMQPTKEVFDSFTRNTDMYLNMYKSWIAALEKMAAKTDQLSREATDQEITREFYSLWIKMYEKAFDSFFEDMPMAGPMKDMMEPVRMMAKINADTFSRMSKVWIKGLNIEDRAA